MLLKVLLQFGSANACLCDPLAMLAHQVANGIVNQENIPYT